MAQARTVPLANKAASERLGSVAKAVEHVAKQHKELHEKLVGGKYGVAKAGRKGGEAGVDRADTQRA